MGTSELDGSGRARSRSDRAHPLPAARPAFIEPSDDVRVLYKVAWPGLTRPLDEVVAAPSGLWIVEHRPWQDIAVARGRVITADADVTVDVQHLDQVRVRVARDLGLTPVEAHALVVVPEEVPALRLEGVVIVGQRLVRQIILSPGRRLTATQLDVLARRTSKVLGHAAPDRPQATPGVAVVSDLAPEPAPEPVPEPEPAPVAGRPASSPFSRLPSRPAPPRTTADRPHGPRVLPEPVPSTEPVPELAAAPAVPEVVPTAESEPVAPPGHAAAPDLGASVPPEHGDEPPPPLPTPEEMGLPPALTEVPAQRHEASADPIWPIAPPPPGWWSAPEPEPELARLVADADPYLDDDEPDGGESDLERTRVVEATSTVPEVDEDESEMGRTRVVDLADERHVTPDRGLPRLAGPAAEHPWSSAWSESAWPEPPQAADGTPTGLDAAPALNPGPADLEPVGAEPADVEPAAPRLVDPGSAQPEPLDQEMLTELVAAGLVGPELIADLIDARLVDPQVIADLIDPEPTGTLVSPQPPRAAPVVSDADLGARDAPPALTDPALTDPAEADHPGEQDPGLADVQESTVPPTPADREVYGPLDDDVELTRIRPPDRPPASQSLAHARRAFFSGTSDDPVTTFPQTPEDEAVQAGGPAARPGRHPAPARPAARLPVAWDDDLTPPSDGSRPHVAWDDPPEAPRRGERPRVAWDDDPTPDKSRPEVPRTERRSVVAGPRPPADHRPVEHTERPDQPVERPSRYRSGPSAADLSGPPVPASPTPAHPGSSGPAQPSGPTRPTRPRAVRTGPWNLSPAQAAAVGGRFPGPMRIRGAFGTGRSVAAAYRAVHLAHTRSGPVAVVVPSSAQIEPMIRRLTSIADTEVLERLVVDVPAGIAQALLAEFGTEVNLAPESVARAWSVAQRSTGLGAAQGRSIGLLLDEVALIRGRSLTDEDDYDRLRQEMPAGLRHQVWVLYEAYLAELRRRNLPDKHDLVRMARAALRAGVPSELTAVVVDDANDLTPDELTMLRETVGTGPDALTVVDDGLPGLLPVGATLGEAGIDIAQRQVDLAHEFRLTGPAWTSLVRLLQTDAGRDLAGTTERPRLAGRLDNGEGPAYLRSQAIRLRRDRLVERVAELVGEGVAPESIALLHVEDEPEPELVAELVRAGVMVRGLDALDVPAVALGRARDARGVEFDHVLVPDARHRDVVPVGGMRWDQRQRRRLIGLALSRSRETAWIAGV